MLLPSQCVAALPPRPAPPPRAGDRLPQVLAAAESNLDPLDMVTLRMEADAAKALAESEAKEAERAAAMKGKDVVIDEEVVDLGFTYNPAAHCYICKQRGHTKVGRLVGRSVGGSAV